MKFMPHPQPKPDKKPRDMTDLELIDAIKQEKWTSYAFIAILAVWTVVTGIVLFVNKAMNEQTIAMLFTWTVALVANVIQLLEVFAVQTEKRIREVTGIWTLKVS